MCIIVSEPFEPEEGGALNEQQNTSGNLRGLRSVECLSFDQSERITKVLFLLLLDNHQKGSSLKFFYPREVIDIEWLDPYPLKSHPNEPEDGEANLLSSIYEQMFEYDAAQDELSLVAEIAPWDYYSKLPKEQIKTVNRLRVNKEGIPRTQYQDGDSKIIFTTWGIDSIPKTGPILISFVITQRSSERTGPYNTVSIDGPKQLLSYVNGHIPLIGDKEKKDRLVAELKFFKNPISFSHNYDVLVLNKPYSDEVFPDLDGSTLITAGLLQSPKGIAKRFITGNPNFQLQLGYQPREYTDTPTQIYEPNQKVYNKIKRFNSFMGK